MAASASNDIKVIIERTELNMGGYMGIYDANTRYAHGLHYQYYSESSLLKAMTYYECDEAYRRMYYYNYYSKHITLAWRYTRGKLAKIITSGVNGTEWDNTWRKWLGVETIPIV